MKTLLLMRHAKSSWSEPGMDDHDRPLNKRGIRDAPRMGNWLKERGLIPSLILSSSALRAQQTAQSVALTLDEKVEVVEDLYLASVGTWKHVLKSYFNNDIVLAIGHNPGLEELVSRVAANYERMPTAAVAWFEIQEDAEQADDILTKLSLQTVWRPKELD
ncbi:SixA phosphatase family protein [Thalassoglobus sp.]|uniref:SixA phosphatase family protein n=1 Tax=Thalassoglobus sp. TaxID=2795869 RepID=UPI003AA8FE4E